MSLTREQKRDLNQISEQLKKIEKLTLANSIDLDVFVADYNKDGFFIYSTEKIALNPSAQMRKSLFEKEATTKTQDQTTVQ